MTSRAPSGRVETPQGAWGSPSARPCPHGRGHAQLCPGGQQAWTGAGTWAGGPPRARPCRSELLSAAQSRLARSLFCFPHLRSLRSLECEGPGLPGLTSQAAPAVRLGVDYGAFSSFRLSYL